MDEKKLDSSFSLQDSIRENQEIDLVTLPLELSFSVSVSAPTVDSDIIARAVPVPESERSKFEMIQKIFSEAIYKSTELRIIQSAADIAEDGNAGFVRFPEMLHVPRECIVSILHEVEKEIIKVENKNQDLLYSLQQLKTVLYSTPVISNYLVFFPDPFGYEIEVTEEAGFMQYIPWIPNTITHPVSSHTHYVSCIKIIPKIVPELLKYEFIKHDRSVSIGDCKEEVKSILNRRCSTFTKSIYVEMYDRNKWELDLLILEAATLTLNSELISTRNETDDYENLTKSLHDVDRIMGMQHYKNIRHSSQLITKPLEKHDIVRNINRHH